MHVMGNENIVLQQRMHSFCNPVECRSIGNHLIRNASHCLYVMRDGLAGVDKCFEFFHYFVAIKDMNGNFRYTVCCGIGSCGFYINDCIHEADRKFRKNILLAV